MQQIKALSVYALEGFCFLCYNNLLNGVTMKQEYEAVPLEQAERFWQERNRVLRARSEALIIAMVGKELARDWWTRSNKAFEGQTPNEQFEQNAERVYGYLMRMAEGEW